MVNQKSRIRNRKCDERGFAILMVVLVLVGLCIIAAPFAISMRQEEHASINFAARIRARLAAIAVLNVSKAQLERSHESDEEQEARVRDGTPSTIFNSPFVDANGEFRVDLRDPELQGLESANPAGVMWGVRAQDAQGKVNVKSASQPFLQNLLRIVFEDDPTRGESIAAAIFAYRTTHQWTSISQLREINANPRVTEAEYHRMLPFLTVHSASLLAELPPGTPALHPVNINTCSEEALRALLLGIRLRDRADEDPHAGVTEAEVDNLIARLRVFRHLGDAVNKNDPYIQLDSAAGLPEPEEGNGHWVNIEGDVVKYTSVDANRLNVAWHSGTEPAATDEPVCARVDEDHPRDGEVAPGEVEVRLIFTNLEHDLARILDAMVAAEPQQLSAESRSAILANAVNPLNDEVLDTNTTTAPLCFRSFNIYAVEATGIVNAPDGRELARYRIREVAQIAPFGELEINVETQEDFERSRQADLAPHVATWPAATQVEDMPPQASEPWTDMVFRRGRLGLEPLGRGTFASHTFRPRFATYFDGPLMRDALRGDTNTLMREPHQLTQATISTTEASDLRPDGIRLGRRSDDEWSALVYAARNDDGLGQSNVPHDGASIVQPFILEMWVKFDPPGTEAGQFDYGSDHFLFDLAQATFSNRVALYYDSTGADQGDLVLSVCDSTNQEIAAQARYPITNETFRPERWYHIAAVVKGIRYNQLALLVNGNCVAQGGACGGRYLPCGTLRSAVGAGDAALPCDNLVGNEGADAFAPFPWPPAGTAIVNGEIVEYTLGGTGLACERGSRGTLARDHSAGAPVEIYGYDDTLSRSHDLTEYPIDHLLTGAEQPTLPVATPVLPAQLAEATVDDGDEGSPEGVSAPTNFTHDETAEYWSPSTDCYQAASGNEIPSGGWLPIAASAMWVVTAGQDPSDDSEKFGEVVSEMEGLLAWTSQRPTTGARAITEPEGIGFITVSANPGGKAEEPQTGEIIKFATAGVALVYRIHPEDTANDPEEQRKIAWYIGYLAGFGAAGEGGEPGDAGGRGCFETSEHEIREGATIRLDCIRLTDNQRLARGHRESRSPPADDPDCPFPFEWAGWGRYGGAGIFQVYRDPTCFEWIRFNYPQIQPEDAAAEQALLANQFLVGIHRNACGTVPDGSSRVGRPFEPAEGAFALMPVFFSSGHIQLHDAHLAILKRGGDEVTLTDSTGQREPHVINHAIDHWVAFRESVQGAFAYANRPRILKFPSGSLPTRPDALFYVGSDAQCHDGDTEDPFHDDEGATEPERPADATFDDIKLYRAAYRTVRLWDFAPAAGGPPTNQGTRGFAPIAAGESAPFYIRIGDLEPLVRQPDPEQPPPPPFRFLPGGHPGWPLEGYLKIDDECLFYRTLYRRRDGHHSAALRIRDSHPRDADGLVILLNDSSAPQDLYVELTEEQAARFPDRGYLHISNSYPDRASYENIHQRVQELATEFGLDPAVIYAWIQLGGAVPDGNGNPMHPGYHHTRESFFYEKQTYDAATSTLPLRLTHRGILDTGIHEIKVVDPDNVPSWYYGEPGLPSAHVINVQLLILGRGCLGTQPGNHDIGSLVTTLEHIPTTLTPRPMVRLRRGENGLLPLDENNNIQTLPDDEPDFDINEPEYEYGIVIEDYDDLPAEGYVQIGNEIVAYAQDRRGGLPTGAVIWNANVRMWDATENNWASRVVPILTGIKRLRQRYGTARETYLEPGAGDVVTQNIDPLAAEPAYWTHSHQHIVRLRQTRYHDRYPLANGNYTPHKDDGRVGYFEFTCALPGTLWTRVNWLEARYDEQSGAITRSTLDQDDPFDIHVMVQIDDGPAWDDTRTDPATSAPVATPVHWQRDFPGRADVRYDPPAHRLKKPIIYLFDSPDEDNYINRIDSSRHGQYGDRIRLRVYFRYNSYDEDDFPAPHYNIPWRTPWVDTITIRYRAPTTVFERREMPY